jgi:transcription termination factor NusB
MDQMHAIEYYINHRDELVKTISSKLGTNWQWERIPPVEQAILLATVSEAKTSKIDRKILIDQALVTTKHFADPESAQYINAILDKVI